MRNPRPLPILMAAVAACSSPISPPPSPPESALVLTGDSLAADQAAVAGERLARPLVVRVTRDGVPVANIPVTWEVTSGTITPLNVRSDAFGYVRALWTLGEAPGRWVASATAPDQPASRIVFAATAWERVSAMAIVPTADQQGFAASSFTLKVRVRGINDIGPRAGIPVTWSGPGSLEPAVSMTDADGIASTQWNPGSVVGTYLASAAVRGAPGPAPLFRTTLRPGPAAQAAITSGPDSVARNWMVPFTVSGLTVDAHGNVAGNAPVEWTLGSAGLTILSADSASGTDGTARAILLPSGEVGPAALRLRVVGRAPVDSHVVRVLPDLFVIRLDPLVATFRSLMNDTAPAVDTVRVGATVHWWLSPFDYELHTIEVLGGTDGTGGGTIPYASPSIVSATFTSVGTHQYRDAEIGATGTVVVVP